ncbi:hypothetical protein FRC08_004448 [Ceratobasidium sp. 394]|nr:hypothetical protein FRC08_004448 [Ceratobasidium sp. 394]
MSTTSGADESLRGFDRLNGLNYPTWEYAATLDLMVHDLWDLFDINSPASIPPPVYTTTSTPPAMPSATTATPAASTSSTSSTTSSTPSTTTTTPTQTAPPAQATLASSTPTINPDYAAWRKRATKATARLVKLVDTAHMHLIMARETPLEQWQNLGEVFSERTAEAILAKRTKLSQMRWDPSGETTLQTFLQSMIAVGTELARANHPVSPIDMCGFIGMAMPDGLRQSMSTLKRIGRLTPETWVRDLIEDERLFRLHKPGAIAKAGRVETGERQEGLPGDQ